MSDHEPMKVLLVMLLVISVVAVAGRLLVNWEARQSPPAACVLVGGSWDWWNGWRCP